MLQGFVLLRAGRTLGCRCSFFGGYHDRIIERSTFVPIGDSFYMCTFCLIQGSRSTYGSSRLFGKNLSYPGYDCWRNDRVFRHLFAGICDQCHCSIPRVRQYGSRKCIGVNHHQYKPDFGYRHLIRHYPCIQEVNEKQLILIKLPLDALSSVGFQTKPTIAFNPSPLERLATANCIAAFFDASIQKAKKTETTEQTSRQQLSFSIMIKPIIYLFLSALLVAISSTCLVASVQITAARIGISEAIISATIVALGTSLPELSTTIMAAKKGYGALAFGNIIGASLMNLLLVLSSTLILSKEAVIVPRAFLLFHFPIVFLILVCLLYNLIVSKSSQFTKNAGMGLLLIYLCYLIGNIWIG